MNESSIPEPLVFNLLKHYLPCIREFTDTNVAARTFMNSEELVRKLKHLGTCVMDVYTGSMEPEQICNEALWYLNKRHISGRAEFAEWAGKDFKSYRIAAFSDGSLWTMKYHDNENRYVHIFPARSSPFTFRVKANTLKSAILYLIISGKDYVTEDDLNRARAMTGLSPVKDVAETEAVTEMIDMIRG